MTVIGLDLHKRYITACAMTEDGEIVAEQRRVVPDVAALAAFFVGLPAPLTVAMEATLYWAWLHDQLVARGITVLVAHAYQVKLLWRARAKTDPFDARKLAELARTRLLPTVWVAGPALRGQQKLLRGRAPRCRGAGHGERSRPVREGIRRSARSLRAVLQHLAQIPQKC